MPLTIDARDRQCIGADVAALDLRIGVGHGSQHRQAAVSRAQIQDAPWRFGHEMIDALQGQHLGNQAARHDAALVHIKINTLEPGFSRQISAGYTLIDALLQQCQTRLDLFRRQRIGMHLWVGVQGQAQAPQDQPSGLIGHLQCALPQGHRGGLQHLAALRHQFCQGHGCWAATSRSSLSNTPW